MHCKLVPYSVIFLGGNFREMLDTVVRINFRGSNFRGTRVRAIDADDVI